MKMFGKNKKQKETTPDSNTNNLPKEIIEGFSENDEEIQFKQNEDTNIKLNNQINNDLDLQHPNILKYKHDMDIEQRLSIVEKNIENIILYLNNNTQEDNK